MFLSILLGLLFLFPANNLLATELEGYVFLINTATTPPCTSYASCGYVVLYDSTRTPIDSCCINANHEYEFFDVTPGVYKILVVCAKEYNGYYNSCYDFNWTGFGRATITGGAYHRANIDCTTHSGTQSAGCCHDCPCHQSD